MSKVLYLGRTAILVHNDAFERGCIRGYQQFCAEYAGRPLSDQLIHASIMAERPAPTIEDSGYATGWTMALLEHLDQPEAGEQTAGQDAALPLLLSEHLRA
jgi:hypothetical protein